MLSKNKAFQVCARGQVHRRLGLTPLLLGLSRRHGGHHRYLLRLHRGLPLSKRHERFQSRPGVHVVGGDRLLLFVAWIASKGAGASTAVNLAINVIQISALVVFSVLALGYRSVTRQARPPSNTIRRRSQPIPINLPRPRTDPRCATPAARHCRCWIQRESRFPTRSTTQKEIPAATSWPILPRRRWWCLTS